MPDNTKRERQNEILSYAKKYGIFAVILLVAIGVSYYVGALSSEVRFYKEKLAGTQQVGNTNQQKPANTNPTAPEIIKNLDKPTEGDKIIGNKDAKYALVEYSDYDCPFCSRFHETAKTFVEQNKDDVVWVYKHFPLVQLHPDAQKKAEAAECVKQLGGLDAFWKFSDALFAEKIAVADLANTASEKAGINSNEFTQCLDSGKGKAGVDADIASGKKVGVNGTPGNFILDISSGEAMTLRGAVPIETLTNTLKLMQSK